MLDRGANRGVAGDEIIGNDIMNEKNACGADLVVSLLTDDKVMMRKSDGDDGSIFKVATTAIGKDYRPATFGFGKGYCSAALGFGRYSLQPLNFGASVKFIKFIEATGVDSTARTIDMYIMPCINIHYSNCVARDDGGQMMRKHDTDDTSILSRLFDSFGADVMHESQHDKTSASGCDGILTVKRISRWGAASCNITVPHIGLTTRNHSDYLFDMLKWTSLWGEEGASKFMSRGEKIQLDEVLATYNEHSWEVELTMTDMMMRPTYKDNGRTAGANFGPSMLGSIAKLIEIIEDSQRKLKTTFGDLLGHQVPRNYQRDEGIDRNNGELSLQETKKLDCENLKTSAVERDKLHNIVLDGYKKNALHKFKLNRLRSKSLDYGNIWIEFPDGDGDIDDGELHYVNDNGLIDISICMEALSFTEEYGGRLHSELKTGGFKSKLIGIDCAEFYKPVGCDDIHNLIGPPPLNERYAPSGRQLQFTGTRQLLL